jgi:hypothetical protein
MKIRQSAFYSLDEPEQGRSQLLLPNRSLNFLSLSEPAMDFIGTPLGYSSAIRSSQYVAGLGALQSRR